ncbi:MAG: terminase family protein [Alphaproteobacteria bacterium]|nr:terminase family protein [Alphaproteobacteria bacterium]
MRDEFALWAGPGQLPPRGDWRVWVFVGGRGAGKTRAGAEWVHACVAAGVARRIALVGQSQLDVRNVMIEGASGLLAVGRTRPTYEPSLRRVSWPNGAQAFAYSAEEPDGLRGPQFDAAWGDEFCAWPDPDLVLGVLRPALRLGAHPRLAITTTPRPIAALATLCATPGAVTTRATMAENADNLAPGFVEDMRALWGGTRFGRQELDGELLAAPDGALWTRDGLARCRGAAPATLDEIVVAVDPPASAGADADACGVIVAGAVGEGAARRGVVLEDATVQGLTPLGWARVACDAAARWRASRIVAESNQGGEMVRTTLLVAGAPVPVRLLRAQVSKTARAEPVAALYERGRITHAGVFAALEAEMCAFGEAHAGRASPDRVDALVWALTDVMLARAAPGVRVL